MSAADFRASMPLAMPSGPCTTCAPVAAGKNSRSVMGRARHRSGLLRRLAISLQRLLRHIWKIERVTVGTKVNGRPCKPGVVAESNWSEPFCIATA